MFLKLYIFIEVYFIIWPHFILRFNDKSSLLLYLYTLCLTVLVYFFTYLLFFLLSGQPLFLMQRNPIVIHKPHLELFHHSKSQFCWNEPWDSLSVHICPINVTLYSTEYNGSKTLVSCRRFGTYSCCVSCWALMFLGAVESCEVCMSLAPCGQWYIAKFKFKFLAGPKVLFSTTSWLALGLT